MTPRLFPLLFVAGGAALASVASAQAPPAAPPAPSSSAKAPGATTSAPGAALAGPSVAASAATTPVKVARRLLTQLNSEGAGAGIRLKKKATAKDPASHIVLLEASPFRLAFYSDVDAGYSPLPGAQGWKTRTGTHRFDDVFTGARVSPHRWGRGKIASNAANYFELWLGLKERQQKKVSASGRRDAEVVVYSLDSNLDGKLDAADKTSACAAATPHHDEDYCLIRQVFGTTLEGGRPVPKMTAEALLPGVRAWTEPADDLAKGKKVGVLFTYTISELFSHIDFNGDGDTSDELLFGDGNGDGKLDDTEQEALRQLALAGQGNVVESLDADPRFKATASQPGILARIRAHHSKLDDAAARRLIENSIVRADMNLLLEYDDTKKNVRYRRKMVASVGFRNALMVLREMTR